METISIETVGILFNPISGKGLGAARAERLNSLLQARSFHTHLIESRPFDRCFELEALFEPLDCIIILGGDGTLMGVLEILARLQLPTYVMPLGNECLCSRECSVPDDAEKVLEMLQRGHVSSYNLGISNGQYFFTMLSIGFDAEVIRHISQHRSGPINRFTYLRAITRLALNHRSPYLNVVSNEKTLIQNQRGFFIAGNTPHYALGINFAARASGQSRELDIYFYPYRSCLGFIWQALRMLLAKDKRQVSDKNYLGTSTELHISCENNSEVAVQADGEYIGTLPVNISAAKHRLKLLK